MLLRAGHQHSPFWLIRTVSWAIAHHLEVVERFPRLMIPEVCLHVGHFMDYCSPFRGLGAISTIDEPRGVFTYRRSTLAGLADSGPFRGLLLTVLGPRSDFIGLWTRRCAYVHDINTHRFGVRERFLWLLNPKARLRIVHQHPQF